MNMNIKGTLIIEQSLQNLIDEFFSNNDVSSYLWNENPHRFVEELTCTHSAFKELWNLSKHGCKTINKSCLSLIEKKGLSSEILEDFLVILNSLVTKVRNDVTKH